MSDLSKQRCPYLGLKGDPVTWYAFPSDQNTCHRPGVPLEIPLDHQGAACVTVGYPSCPVFQLQEDNKAALRRRSAALLPNKRKVAIKWWFALFAVGAVVLVGAIIGAWASLPAFSGQLITATVTFTPWPTLTSSPTETFAPTTTPSSTPTPTLPATATPYALEGIVAFDSNLRAEPRTSAAILTQIPSGATVFILGRDSSAKWVYIRTPKGTLGWLAATQLLGTVDVSIIPLAPPLMTPTVTAGP